MNLDYTLQSGFSISRLESNPPLIGLMISEMFEICVYKSIKKYSKYIQNIQNVENLKRGKQRYPPPPLSFALIFKPHPD